MLNVYDITYSCKQYECEIALSLWRCCMCAMHIRIICGKTVICIDSKNEQEDKTKSVSLYNFSSTIAKKFALDKCYFWRFWSMYGWWVEIHVFHTRNYIVNWLIIFGLLHSWYEIIRGLKQILGANYQQN